MTEHSLPLFEGTTLFASIARTVCKASCLPRKELYESWEVARRVRRRLRGGRVIDLACGHGLLAHIMLILDRSSPAAIGADVRLPPSSIRLAQALAERWPDVVSRVELRQMPIGEVELQPDDVVVSAHACGGLTDEILDRAIGARSRIGVLPCCHSLRKQDCGGFEGWLDGALAIDVNRAARLKAAGYCVWTQTIPSDITPKNRLLMAWPADSGGD